MKSTIAIPRKCNKCAGSGVWVEPINAVGGPYTTNPCPGCNGTGYQEFYQLVLPTNCFWGTDVLNCIELAEYALLTVKLRELVHTVLSVGLCDLNIGTVERSVLWDAFGTGTSTRQKLRKLLKEV